MSGELFAVRVGRVYVSSSICAIVLAMALLGPVPAAVIAGGASALDWAVHRKLAWAGLTNVFIASISAFAGGLLVAVTAGGIDSGGFAASVFAAGVLNAALNLALLAACRKLRLGASFRRDLAEAFLPMTPFHLLGVTLATAAAQIAADGLPALAAALPALVVSELLLRSVAAKRAQAEKILALTSERANLLQQALTAETAEREWISGHLHDTTLQSLAAARQGILAGAPDAARAQLDGAIVELRRTLAHVHPGSVASRGLEPTLHAFADQVLRRGGTACTVAVDIGAEEHEALLYSLGRELLGNAAKHARASRVDLRIAREHDAVHLRVVDDGIGFSPAAVDDRHHFGLLTARRRIAAAGGTMRVEGSPGAGALIDVVLPVVS